MAGVLDNPYWLIELEISIIWTNITGKEIDEAKKQEIRECYRVYLDGLDKRERRAYIKDFNNRKRSKADYVVQAEDAVNVYLFITNGKDYKPYSRDGGKTIIISKNLPVTLVEEFNEELSNIEDEYYKD